MRLKRRRKSSRFRGTHTHGRGFKKKARGSGHRGGVGMAGTGKRADQRKTLILNLPEPYFGKSKALRRGKVTPKLEVINLDEISEKFAGKKELDLEGYKILSRGELKEKIKITASSASKSALDKIKKSGSEIHLSK
jgi:large subunit ribosomal protein L15